MSISGRSLDQGAIVEHKETTTSASYVCLSCSAALMNHDDALICQGCQITYKIREGIPVFTQKDEYWCNVDRTKMQALIKDAEASGDWLAASQKHIPHYMRAYEKFYRADAQFIFPINSQSRVLDAGSMWGGLTVPVAQYCREVYAVDKTWETLRFMQVRALQMGIYNIIPTVASIHHLPFPDGYFDHIILNGVLEWLALDQDIVLDQHWDGRRKEGIHKHQLSPRAMQLAGLRELRRVLKQEGSIYIAIENRIGIQYFFWSP